MKLLQKKEIKTTGRQSNSLMNKKQTIIFTLVAAAIVVIIVIYFLFFSGKMVADRGESTTPDIVTQAPDARPTETPTVEVLPDDRLRPEKDPFGTSLDSGFGSIRLSGILSGDDGRGTAILIDGSTSYIVGIGDYIGDSEWYLAELGDNTAILTNGQEEMTVGFEGRV